MSHKVLNVPEFGMLDTSAAVFARRACRPDAAQQAAIERLQDLYARLLAFKVAQRSVVRRLLTPVPRGIYLWGGAGSGKSLLLDCFFAAVPYRRKRCVHFRSFMQEVRCRLALCRAARDPVREVVGQVVGETRLLCLDGFHLEDRDDALLLPALIEALLAGGVVLVLTANVAPQTLRMLGCSDSGLQAIGDAIDRHLDPVPVDGGVNYRLEILLRLGGGVETARMAECFSLLAEGEGDAGGFVDLFGALVPALRLGRAVAWFDLPSVCAGVRTQNACLELARRHHTVLLSDNSTSYRVSETLARRFLLLLEALHARQSKVVFGLEKSLGEWLALLSDPEARARAGELLHRMRTRDYLALPHLA